MTCTTFVLFAASAVSALQAALNSSATWTMERRLDGSSRPLVSSGVVRCRMGEGIVWETREPFAASVSMTTNAMVFVDEDGRREKALGDLPHYADVRAATDAFAAGKADAFDGVFAIREEALPDGGWRLTLEPEVAAMKRLVASVELTGAALPTNAVLRSPGCVSEIRFRPLRDGESVKSRREER